MSTLAVQCYSIAYNYANQRCAIISYVHTYVGSHPPAIMFEQTQKIADW